MPSRRAQAGFLLFLITPHLTLARIGTHTMNSATEAEAKTNLPVQPQISGTQSYVCPKIPKQLIGVTEIAYKGPDAKPTLHLIGEAPKENHMVRKTILFDSRYSQDVFDDQTYVQVMPLPEDSPELTKFQ